MPGVEVTEAQIGQKAAEADRAREQEHPPGPNLAPPKGRRGQPEIEGADGDDGAAERYAVVDHEVKNAAAVQGAQVAGPHAEITLVVRQESAGRPKKQRE